MPRSRSPARRARTADTLNFWLTNRIPRQALTRLAGWYSRIESRRLTRLSIAVWQRFVDDLRLDEAQGAPYTSLRACFTRALRPGTRPVEHDPQTLASPCDAVVGAHGPIDDTTLIQAKGLDYTLDELLPDPALVERHRDGHFVTLRLKSSMYHRFHAPCDCRVRYVDYVSGEVFNVNPPALRRIPRLFCRNERCVVPLLTDTRTGPVTLVPVAAVLVASMRLHCLPVPLDLRYRGPNRLACEARYARGDELGWFEHGSTIIVLTGGGFVLDASLRPGGLIRTGEALLRRVGSV